MGKRLKETKRPGGQNRCNTVLNICLTDNTFEQKTFRDETLWVGKCLFCKTKLTVALDGSTQATIEHILPLNHGGTNDLSNLSLACTECNSEKGRRHDNGKKPIDLIDKLLSVRQQRWRDLDNKD